MLDPYIRQLFADQGIEKTALLPFSEVRVTYAKLLQKHEGFAPKSVLVFLLPYFTAFPENFSCYAAAEDYHLLIPLLAKSLQADLQSAYPEATFLFFTDHSPIDERHAAARAGLGVIGQNRLLLTEEYGSLQFIACCICDVEAERLGQADTTDIAYCIGCGKCLAACPTGALRGDGDCLSAITQKKGDLTLQERKLLQEYNTVWGCDICQKTCPYTQNAIRNGTARTTIPFFRQNLLTRLDEQTLASLQGEAFLRRAFAWRGRSVIERNVKI